MVTLLASLLAAGALAAPPPQRALVAGPVIAGSRVVWGERVGGLSVLRAWPQQAPLWRSASSWLAGPLGGSQTIVAFSRSFEGCPGQPGVACPVETQAVAGPLRGSLRPLGPAERCTAGGAHRRLAVSGSLVAFLELGCDSATNTVAVRDGSHTVFQRQGAACCDVSLAGRFLAVRSGSAVDVVDLRTRRLAYRALAPAGESIAAFDVQADGKLALALGAAPDGTAALVWRTPGSQILQRAGFRVVPPAGSPLVRLVADRLVAERRVGSSTELVVAGLPGTVRTLTRFAAPVEPIGGFDAGDGRLTWASRRITSSRVDCPPRGLGRPCILLKSGVATVWVAGLASGAPRPIARWTFVDAP